MNRSDIHHRFLLAATLVIAAAALYPSWTPTLPAGAQPLKHESLNAQSIVSAKSEKSKRTRLTPKKAAAVQVVDVLAVTVRAPLDAVKSFTLGEPQTNIDCDVLIVGGGIGGIAAALRTANSGLKVCLIEETDWLGGQMTSQGVSALDENYLIETTGSTLKYQQFRSMVRQHYQSNYQPTKDAATNRLLNPGSCWVSYVSFEPKVAVGIIDELLEPLIRSGSLSVFKRHKVVQAKVSSKRLRSVRTVALETGASTEFNPKVCLDATELGELLPLCKMDYRSGAESQLDTQEPHAPLAGDRENVQDFTYPFAVEFRPGENHTIEKPDLYERFKASGILSFFGFKMFENSARAEKDGRNSELLPFWTYRRLLDRNHWTNPPYEFDLAMINWMGNDLRGENIIDQPAATTAARLALGKALSLSFLYWLQTEAPRDDGGTGYPELCLRPEVMGTKDGLSKYPYIRESRRIRALHTITEQEIAASTTSGARATPFHDAVGIGFYPIDIHGKEEKTGAAQGTRPFQIPLGALMPASPINLIAACKNIGTTHITNGAYRLHPVEWAIGEAAGALSVLSIAHGKRPGKILKDKRLLRRLQRELVSDGSPVFWYDDVPASHPAFPAIQFLSISEIMSGENKDLHFRPDDLITKQEAAAILLRCLKLHPAEKMDCLPEDLEAGGTDTPVIMQSIKRGLLPVDNTNQFGPAKPLIWKDLKGALKTGKFAPFPDCPLEDTITRAAFARWLYESDNIIEMGLP